MKWMTAAALAAMVLLGDAATWAGESTPARQALWFAQPAQNWERQALPLGNGRLGAMVFGGMKKEQIQFNEESLWIGDEKNTGAYQAFGDLFLEFDHPEGTAYRRELDIERAVHTVTYTSGGVQYRREYFASHPAGLIVLRYTADKPGAYSGALELTDAHQGKIVSEGSRIRANGSLLGYYWGSPRGWIPELDPASRKKVYDVNLNYESQVLVLHEGGNIEVKDGKLFFHKADALTVLLDAGTDFIRDRSTGWQGVDPHAAIQERLEKAEKTPYATLLAEQLKDYQGLFGRLKLSLGTSADTVRQLPTDKRLKAYTREDPYTKPPAVSPDPELEALLFQYGRYLMIASSRKGDLPATLQGVWNNSNTPAWHCDYHSDVNIQMNYWFVDMANLPGCFEPLSEWLWSVIPVKREATFKQYKIRGFALRSENGLFGGMSWHFVPGDAAWVAQNIWDHYAFTQDRNYLESRAYPIMKELCEFWEDYLKERPDGKLVSQASISPEHGPRAEGNSYEQQLAYDLFTNYIEASKVLGKDEDFRKKIESMRGRLLGPQIGKWGQLQEWAEDRDDPKDQHRHTSHLIAVYPGRQITPYATPELAKAAGISLTARGETGDSRREWAWVLRSAMWARLAEAEKAYHCVTGLFSFNLFPNLFTWHPPLQIDGNFGYPAAVGEMLIQSHEQDAEGLRMIRLLPALPKAWPTGSIKGICARGGFTVDMTWKDGKVTDYRIASPEPKKVRLQVGTESKIIQSEAAQ